ncbi:hypothetical protein CU097_006305 [Rhizopus azygosporus]|uniref:Nucleoside diphosphate kinase n=1 Tax=Rhizopus azygosporus TaxID=86630 RepID=A0A367K656_RHIAZ|nr:hypothetical protein CU097_006305 [Rhizopus azygosporus]
MVNQNKIRDIQGACKTIAEEHKENDLNNGACDRQVQTQRTVAIIKPDGLSSKQKIMEGIQSKEFKVLQERTLQLTKDQAKDLFESQKTYEDFDKLVTWISSSEICALLLEKENAIDEFKFFLGPRNPKKAKKKKHATLRALFGTDSVHNAVDGSDSVEHAEKTIRLLFDGCQQPLKQSTSDASEETKHEAMSDPLPSPIPSAVLKTDLALQADEEDVHATCTPQKLSEGHVASVEENKLLHSNSDVYTSNKTERHGLEESEFTQVASIENNMQHEASGTVAQVSISATVNNAVKKDNVSQNQIVAETAVGALPHDANDIVSKETENTNDRHTREAESTNDKKSELSNVKKERSKEETQSTKVDKSKEEATVAIRIQQRASTTKSLLRQPSIKIANVVDATQKPVHRIERKPVPVTPPKDVKSTSKIAKLSPIMHKQESTTRKPLTENAQKKKPTKVSKHLPRVALLASQKPKQEPKDEPIVEAKEIKTIKKKISTKEFISRLTAPTVASNNKKLATNQVSVAQKITPQTKVNATGKSSKAEFLEQTKILKT